MISALIVAAGQGIRMGPNTDKLFLIVAGRPIIAHTWQRFEEADCIDEIILVVREGMQKAFVDLSVRFHFQKKFCIVPGGIKRQESVWNGLQALSAESEIVAIHDGARPCPSEKLIETTIQAAREMGAAVAAQPVTDTIKESADGEFISAHLERQRLWSVQTPQTFRVEIIRRALLEVRRKKIIVTDDTAACELIRQPVKLISSAAPNPKVTVPEDLPYIEMLLKKHRTSNANP
ncbi:MAG: 2-C-methyl-D-erythritol 4-phosphate cytidylyltransferase [Verrucomicrobiota bacterium]|nr:2-C-methyl-D-erythritol 4-phosphate cytidylyltransferase [Verrucomicrobiota bacterium]